MSVEGDLEQYAQRITALRQEEKEAIDNEVKQRATDMRSVLLMNAEGLIARSPQALKAKAKIVWDEDWIQSPTSTGGSFVRSLLRDLLQWQP